MSGCRGRGRAEGEGVGVVQGQLRIPMEMGMSPLVTGGRDTKMCTSENHVEPRGVTQTSETGNLKVSGTTRNAPFWL